MGTLRESWLKGSRVRCKDLIPVRGVSFRVSRVWVKNRVRAWEIFREDVSLQLSREKALVQLASMLVECRQDGTQPASTIIVAHFDGCPSIIQKSESLFSVPPHWVRDPLLICEAFRISRSRGGLCLQINFRRATGSFFDIQILVVQVRSIDPKEIIKASRPAVGSEKFLMVDRCYFSVFAVRFPVVRQLNHGQA